MDDIIKPRYFNPPASNKEKLIFNYDELFNPGAALYVTEGAIDALSIGPAVALSDSHSSKWKFDELKKAEARGRDIVFVIDKNDNGYDLGVTALKHGWSVTVMPDGIDDANKCRRAYGHLWLLNHLATTKFSGLSGEVTLRLKCNLSPKKRKITHVR